MPPITQRMALLIIAARIKQMMPTVINGASDARGISQPRLYPSRAVQTALERRLSLGGHAGRAPRRMIRGEPMGRAL